MSEGAQVRLRDNDKKFESDPVIHAPSDADSNVRRLRNLYRILARSNDAMMRAGDEADLFAAVCRIAVDVDGVASALIGVVNESSESIVVAASCTNRREHFDATVFPLTTEPMRSGGLAAKAYVEMRRFVSNNYHNDDPTAPAPSGTEGLVVRAAASFPIARANTPYAVLAVFSEDTGAFDDEIVELLDEMAKVVGFALDNFDRELQRRHGENALREKKAHFYHAMEHAPLPIMIHAEGGEVLQVNRAFCESTGYSITDVPTTEHWAQKAYGARSATILANIERLYSIKQRVDEGESEIRCRDGTKRSWQFSSAPLGELPDGRPAVIGMAVDVTARRDVESRLRASEAHFREMYLVAPLPYQLLETETATILDVNEAWLELLGYERKDVVGKPFFDFLSTEALPTLAHELPLLADRGRINAVVLEIRCNDSSSRLVQIDARIGPDNGGKPNRAHCILTDVTERLRVETDLRLWASVFSASGEGIVITDASTRILSINRAFTAITGYQESEILGNYPKILQSGLHDAEFYRAMWSSLQQSGYWQGEIWNRRKRGEIYPAWLGISAVRNSQGAITNFVGISRDISGDRANQAKVEFLAYHDILTELPNRRMAQDRLQQGIARANRGRNKLALLFVDLDNFKWVNDTLGHSTGDALLKAVAERLRSCVRATDTVSREGGDEFLVMLTDIADPDGASEAAAKIVTRLAEPFNVDGHELSSTASVGVALYPDDGGDFETLLKKADIAMYNAKEAGRNIYRFFAEPMRTFGREQLMMRKDLQHALERREFVLEYQPQVSLADGRIVGAEALIRWRHPERGLILPGQFIRIAEECGLIVQIGDWVLREACRQAMEWRRSGCTDFVVAVNISALQFKRGDLEQVVAGALEESGLDGAFLELELTESILIQNTQKSLDTIGRLKRLGVTFSIDDFGTGYSSLAYLKRLPVDKLKIDQSFVRDIAIGADDSAIVLAIITLAHSLRYKVIAEGVETIAQADFLRRHACDQMQGFLFSRAVPAEEFLHFLRRDQVLEISHGGEANRSRTLESWR